MTLQAAKCPHVRKGTLVVNHQVPSGGSVIGNVPPLDTKHDQTISEVLDHIVDPDLISRTNITQQMELSRYRRHHWSKGTLRKAKGTRGGSCFGDFSQPMGYESELEGLDDGQD